MFQESLICTIHSISAFLGGSYPPSFSNSIYVHILVAICFYTTVLIRSVTHLSTGNPTCFYHLSYSLRLLYTFQNICCTFSFSHSIILSLLVSYTSSVRQGAEPGQWFGKPERWAFLSSFLFFLCHIYFFRHIYHHHSLWKSYNEFPLV